MCIEENSIEAKLAEAINKEVTAYAEKLLESIKSHGKIGIAPDGFSFLVNLYTLDDAVRQTIPAVIDDFCKFTSTSDFIEQINAEYEEENDCFDDEDKLDYIDRTLSMLHEVECALRKKQKELINKMEK